jgi:hypothetical protein
MLSKDSLSKLIKRADNLKAIRTMLNEIRETWRPNKYCVNK